VDNEKIIKTVLVENNYSDIETTSAIIGIQTSNKKCFIIYVIETIYITRH